MSSDDLCAGLIEIAEDADKTEYMKRWVDSKLENQDIVQLLSRYRVIRSLDQPEQMDKLEIDWLYLGMNKRYASVRLNWRSESDSDHLSKSEIDSVSFGQGRSSIIVELRDSKSVDIDWAEKSDQKTKRIDDRVLVYCEE